MQGNICFLKRYEGKIRINMPKEVDPLSKPDFAGSTLRGVLRLYNNGGF
jgi:hypothetical protein